MKRLVALLAAVALVGGAVLVRRAADGDGDGGRDEVIDLLCARELESVCRSLAADGDITVTVEDPGVTYGRLTASDATLDHDVWLVPAPWPAMVADVRGRSAQPPVLGEPSEPLAATSVVMVGWDDRVDLLEAACGTLDGTCLADEAGRRWADLGGSAAWGVVRPGLDDPAITTAGLTGLQLVVGDLLGTPTFASNDLALGDVVDPISRLAAIEPSTLAGGSPLDQLLRFGPSTYDVVVDLAAVAEPAVSAARDRDRIRAVDPAAVVVDVVAVAPEGAASPLSLDAVTAALRDAGWGDASTSSGAGMLSGGVYVALQRFWEEIAP